MALQLKRNKNQYIRKGKSTSAPFKTHQDVNIVDVSTLQSGVEIVPLFTPVLSSGIQPGVERAQTYTPILNSGVQSGVERVPIDIPNESLESTEECAKVAKLNALCKQHSTNSCTEVGVRSLMPEESFDAGGTIHAHTVWNPSSEHFPKLYSESYSKSCTGSISQVSVNDFAGQQRCDFVNNNQAPHLPKTLLPEQLPSMPSKMAEDNIWSQHSPISNRGVNHRSFTIKKHHSCRLQKECSSNFSNNLDEDSEGHEDLHWEYPGERDSMDQQMLDQQVMGFDIQYQNLKKHSQIHYGEERLLDNIKQDNHPSKASHLFGGQCVEQTEQILSGQAVRFLKQMQGDLYMGSKENVHLFERDSGYTPSWQEERGRCQLQDGKHVKRFSIKGMEDVGPVPTRHLARTVGPGSSRHHAGTIGQMPHQVNKRSIQQLYKCSVGQMHGGLPGNSVEQMHGGLQGNSVEQIHGGLQGNSVEQMHGGLQESSVEQMQPYYQSEVIHPFGQRYMGELQDVHYEHNDMGPPWNFSKAAWQGDSQGNTSYSEGVSNFQSSSPYMTDRKEFASGHLDQWKYNTWFRNLVQNMKELVEREGLIVKDVIPDGNCLFTAVTDQLRVRGNFNFTPSRLRSAAIDYLKENPKQNDGTHLEHFLINESWDHYLGRMCNDREWGEHIILRAISEVLRCRIIVLGGMSGKSRTVVQPQHITDGEERKIQKENEAIGSKTVKDESIVGAAKSEVSVTETQLIQTGATAATSETDAKAKDTDIRNRKADTSSLSENKKTKKDKILQMDDKDLQMGEDLYIGLVGEMHYVSLRKKDWEERLHDKLRANLQKRQVNQKKEADSLLEDELGEILKDDFSVDHTSGTPVLHLNFLCREIIKLLLRQDLMPIIQNALSYKDEDSPDWSYEIVGKEEFVLERLPIPMPNTHYTDLFSSNKESYKWKSDFVGSSYVLTKDTLLVELEDNSLDIDLIIDRTNSSSSVLRLRPVNPSLWGHILCCELSGVMFLKHVIIDSARLLETKGREAETSDLSFRCSWPREAAEYIKRYRPNSWPEKAILRRIVSEGCRVVPSKEQGDDTLWEFSFYAAKKVLLSEAVSRHQRNCYKLWRLIIRACIKDVQHHSELFRSVMFYSCEVINAEIWENNPATCVLYMTDRLIIGIQRRFVPDYFIQNINLIHQHTHQDVSYLKEKLQMIRYNFFVTLYFVADNFALSSNELLYSYDNISTDLTKFCKDNDFQRSLSDLILPAVHKEVKTFVEGRLYIKAEETILKFYERALRFNSSLDFSCFSKQFLEQLPIQMQWCLAFYIDKRHGTNLTKDIGENHNTVPATDLFGPELVRILGGFNVPVACTQGKEIVYFVDRVIDMFFELYLENAMVALLRFFLRKTYVADKNAYIFEIDSIQDTNSIMSKGEALREKETKSINKILFHMFEMLFEELYRENRHSEFKDFLLQFENICDRFNTEDKYKYLQELCELLGCFDKAERVKVKCLSLKSKETDINDVD